MINPYSVAVDGYNNGPFSIGSDGYMSMMQQIIDTVSSVITYSPFGGSKKEDKLEFIRAMDEIDIPVITNFIVQFIYQKYFKERYDN